ncbi:catalytic LigB subunit of putative aromatic ring-opening dioxygenase [Melanomma pulvis-pyrius CBS 109.77]|uniref:Catalytic LigB subunit of putative aromatic ring-opening dioxygenase n=1 Tax=Melanomma pulvis-pyrius CBS 109.77 TaxID=1314802 RepID=A0A6A6XQ95_9PLEO|nr:catalytic LigB subunit of putative aromatic ring-opening dioxygenase [Melanomma pulvis-pyrius CBS 109.77]
MTSSKSAPHSKSLFISHGTGPFPLLNGPHEQPFLETLKRNKRVLSGVKAIILFSAHWETDHPCISGAAKPGVYYDYEEMRPQLPPATFEFRYDADGHPELAKEISAELTKQGFQPEIDYQRGFDHAVYVPMTILRPEADIPIVQMSVLKAKTEQEATDRNLALGRAMQRFVNEGYMVIGSGNTYHDFPEIAKAYFSPEPGASVSIKSTAFEEFLAESAAIQDVDARCKVLAKWREAPGSWEAHTVGNAEHFWPFLVAAGAGRDVEGRKIDDSKVVGAPMPIYLW